MTSIHDEPPIFAAAAAQLREARMRSELDVREIPAPAGVSSHAIAFAADVRTGDEATGGDSPHGAGRLILLYDPTSAAEWGGPFRIVCFAQAPLEVDIGVDPFIADVAWSWLIDALDSRHAAYTNASGTATKTLSTGFGSLESQGDGAQLELRASWTPLGDDFASHAASWSELLCLLAGIPHLEGVTPIDAGRGAPGPTAKRRKPHG